MSRPVEDLRTDPPQLPVGGSRVQVSAPAGGGSLIDLSERDGTNQHAIALDERQIGSHHQFGAAEHFPHRPAFLFAEQPRQHRARFRVDSQRAPRSSSSSSNARCC